MLSRIIPMLAAILLLGARAVPAEEQLMPQIQLAERYEKEGRFEEALKIYRGLLTDRPEDSRLLGRIQGIYKELKRYPELIEFLNQRAKKNPGDFNVHLALGEAFFLSNRVQEAREVWRKTVALAPQNEDSYLLVGSAFWERGMLAEAEEIFLRGRRGLNDNALFAERLAHIHELQADYGAATSEYLIWLNQDVRRLSYVNTRLAQFPKGESVEEMVEATLMAAVMAEPEKTAFRYLLGHHLIRRGKPDQAYEQFLILNDGEKDTRGEILMDFAGMCSNLSYYTAAIKACQEVVARYPDTPSERKARLEIGHNLVVMEQHEQALVAYEELVRRHPTSSESAEALYAMGEIRFLHLNDVESALAIYRALVKEVRKGPRSIDAAFRIGDCLAVKGELDQAQAEYQRLAQGPDPEDVREKAAYKLAELSLLEGGFMEAKERFDQVVREYPQGFFVNDALIYATFLDQGLAEGQEPLEAYVLAMRLGFQRHYQEALLAYQSTLDQFPATVLGAQILLQMAFTREKIGKHQEALADLKNLKASYPKSRLCPEAQRRIGEIYERRLQDIPMAIKAYEQLLSDYPRYLFLDDVRKKVRQLKGEETS
jgi:tetratricopeptide (TPR) repeat protein